MSAMNKKHTAFIEITPEMKSACDTLSKTGEPFPYRPIYKKDNGNWHVALDYDEIHEVAFMFFAVGAYTESQKQEEKD